MGIAASCACALHCALTPLLLGSFSVVGLGVLADERFEWALVGASAALGGLSLVSGYFSRHRRRRPVALFALGVVVILAARILFDEDLRLEIPAVIMGAGLIASAHLLNLKLCNLCPDC
jgi:hypothetical protein